MPGDVYVLFVETAGWHAKSSCVLIILKDPTLKSTVAFSTKVQCMTLEPQAQKDKKCPGAALEPLARPERLLEYLHL